MMARFKPEIFDKVYDWYTTGIRQRLQPDGAIIICMTRWGKRDLVGQILDRMTQRDDVDQWRYIEFPAILPSGNALWPEYWPLRLLNPIKAELPSFKWNAQYQQNPTNDDNAIIKRSDWQLWEKDEPPKVNYIIMTMDTAIEKTQTADYSAAIIFGVWENEEDGNTPHLILLNAWRDRLEFPELKAKAKELYKEWKPDSTIIEKKASGGPLIYELRRAGVYVQEYTPSRGRAGVSNDKIARLNAVADIFASKRVWAPNKRWAEEVIDEVADFPTGRYDDMVDCVSLALSRFRAGGFIGTQHDKEGYEEEEKSYTHQTKKYY
jgi:predicted phage terminase large subunit-like protein